MPVQPTYPGVYIQEVPSGVRTITGVSTSVTAFIGQTKRGPINKPEKIFSYTDFESRFGGLSSSSELSYSVKQFFLNGGSVAIIVRLAKDPVAAKWEVANNFRIEALHLGKDGNNIEVRINYLTDNPDSTFNITANYTSPDNRADNSTEVFPNLSMNSHHPRYVENIVIDCSKLIKVTRLTDNATLAGLPAGYAESGMLGDVGTLVDTTHNRFILKVNGLDPVIVQLNVPADINGADPGARLTTLCNAIQTKVISQANGQPELTNFKCTPVGGNQIQMTSGVTGEFSRIEVLPNPTNDVSLNLKLGLNGEGREIDAASTIRPLEVPNRSTITSGDIFNANIVTAPGVPSADIKSFWLSIDGYVPDLVAISTAALAGTNLLDRITEIAARIENAVRALRTSSLSYKGFTCSVTNGGAAAAKSLVLSPGSRGKGSSIVITEVSGDAFASKLKLLAGIDGATSVQPDNVMLQGGNEQTIDDASAYNIYVGSRLDRTGIYALESEDIFNILCLPSVTNSGILMESAAYCLERRAFMIIDPPPASKKPNEMASMIAGVSLPKIDNAAVYYPSIYIADPLNNGLLRNSAPCGTIAGLYSRNDSNRGVWKAPAGTEANLVGVQGVEYKLNDRENGLLNPLAINCLRIFPDAGAVAWGSRTLNGNDSTGSEYKYIPVRRTALFIEESLYRGLKWVVFEPNDEPLWAQIRLNVGAFMHDLFTQGAFQGRTPKEAYFVKCDKETTTQNDINLGKVNIWVGFAPLKPAEFVIIYLQQIAGQILT